MSQTLQERIAAALARVTNPRTGTDVVAAEMVRDIATTTGGKVRLTMLLSPSDPATLVRDVRKAIEAVDGVTEARVDVKDASEANGGASHAPPAPSAQPARALPVMNAAPAAAPRPSAPTPVSYPNLGRIIAVSSGKGGVGKSTVATNLAIALAATGARVGLMDADVYGPNVPRMMGVNAPPPVVDEKIIPLQAHGVKVISLGFLIERDQPAIWRGPIVMKIVTQFLRDVAWGQLDYFLVDMPPGTGDAQLSLVQATHVDGAIIVTTPQDVATGDALRGAKMFQRVNVPVLGIVENMSTHVCSNCGHEEAIFGAGGGARMAAQYGVALLGQLPLDIRIRAETDEGRPTVIAEPSSSVGRAYLDTARRTAARLSLAAATAPGFPKISVEDT
jgi:ATP-binding protein involved in chromosome partitioning